MCWVHPWVLVEEEKDEEEEEEEDVVRGAVVQEGVDRAAEVVVDHDRS